MVATDPPRRIETASHAVVHRDDGEFAAWPFNGGLWTVADDDVLAGFFAKDCDYAVEGNLDHGRISTFGEFRTARTRDGGETWESAETIGQFPELSERVLHGPETDLGPFDLTDDGTLLSCWSAPDFWADWSTPWVRVSEDGGDTWSPPAALPTFHFHGIQGRPSYLVREDGTILLFGSAVSEEGEPAKATVLASFDDGQHWSFLSTIAGNDGHAMICPAPARLANGRIVAAVRANPTWNGLWTECYASDDGGRTWEFLSRVNDHGAPGTLTVLDDGRLLSVYGYRQSPQGVRCRFSEDGGETWGREWIVRDDGANADLGYPRAVEVEPGRVLAVYYLNTEEGIPADGGVRHVASTAFDVPE